MDIEPLLKKLRKKDTDISLVINAPSELYDVFSSNGFLLSPPANTSVELLLLFINSKDEFMMYPT